MSWSVVKGDMRQLLPILARESVDSIVCDPPYGLSKEPDVVEVLEHWIRGDDYVHKGGGFMGKGWDSFVPGPSYWKACYDALKPGGHLIAFGGTRTYDLLVIAIRMAGFEIRDQLAWMYGSGFPKSMDVSKAIDKAARGVPQGGADPTSPNHGRFKTMMTEGSRGDGDAGQGYGGGPGAFMAEAGVKVERELVEEAQQWEGWGTALKPAFEPIVLARKPLGEKTVAANVLANGTGALNIDATRIATNDSLGGGAYAKNPTERDQMWGEEAGNSYRRGGAGDFEQPEGRWPANVVLSHTEDCKLIGRPNRDGDAEVEIWSCADDCPVFLLDQQSGERPGCKNPSSARPESIFRPSQGNYMGQGPIYPDTGGASRFFYNAKVSKSERNAGLPEGMTNKHPTLKPIELMRWLVRLVTPAGGIVFDPFCGSGSTGCAAAMEGFSFVGIDLDEEDTNVEVAQHRIAHWERQSARATTIV